MSTTAQPLMTVEEFEKLPDPTDGSKLELVRGEIVVMPPPQGRHGLTCSKVDRKIGTFVDEHKLGWITSNDAGVIFERSPDTLRGPDVAFWSIARQPTPPERYFEIPPDLAVEVLSPSDRRRDVRAKVKEYLFYSVRMVWLIDPEDRSVTVFTGSPRGVVYDEDDTLDGGDVLPGFSCKVADLFV